jgi:hypothetical protein
MKKIVFFAFVSSFFISLSCKDHKSEPQVAEPVEIRQWKPEDTRSITGVTAKRGLIIKTENATPGYVLFQPSASKKTYLINMDGEVVHTWKGDLNCMQSYLLENGHLFRLERDPDFPVFAAGGQSGRIKEYDWEGNLIWDFKYANENELIHHDFEILPNGNILAISYEVKSYVEAVKAGKNPESIAKAGIWPDKIIEVKPKRPNGGDIVWEWYMWDHLVQDFDKTKANYGIVAENPGKININAGSNEFPHMTEEQINGMKQMGFLTSNATADNQGSDITHTNAISYSPELDQIVISSPNLGEIFIIDHSISTEEAKGSPGDILYRWGNPANYNRGSKEDQRLFGQHDVKFIPKGYPGEGHLMVFNNDIPDPNNKMPNIFAAMMSQQSPDPQVAVGDVGNYSAVYQILPPTKSDGSYNIPDEVAIGPEEVTWSYTAPDKYSLYSPFISGAQRMKNGNTLVTSGAKGRFIEVTPDGDIVWEYWNPYNDHYTLPDGSPAQPTGPFLYHQFRSTHFAKDFPAFSGRDLKPISPQPEPFVFKMPPPPPMEKDSVQ